MVFEGTANGWSRPRSTQQIASVAGPVRVNLRQRAVSRGCDQAVTLPRDENGPCLARQITKITNGRELTQMIVFLFVFIRSPLRHSEAAANPFAVAFLS